MDRVLEYATYVLFFLAGVMLTLLFVLVADHIELKREMEGPRERDGSHIN